MVSRIFRDVTYEIKVSNPDHISKGIKTITVDGKMIESNKIPVMEKGPVFVEVTMG